MDERVFRSRQELIAGYNEALRRSTERYEEEGRSTYGEGWIKTQLLETDIRSDSRDSHADVLSRIRGAVEASGGNLAVEELDEERFYLLTHRGNQSAGSFYVDADDPRFVVLYSKAKADSFNEAISKLTQNAGLDHAWFPKEFLRGLKRYGYFRGYGGSFSNAYFLNREEAEGDIEDDPRYRDVSSKSRGQTERYLQLISDDPILQNEFALTSLRIKKEIPENPQEFILDDITYTGKFTSVGKSFTAHKRLVESIKEQYREIVVGSIEANYCLKYKDAELQGDRLLVVFPRRENRLLDFAAKLFSGKKPFMLWGVPDVISDTFVRVHVADLHIGSSITFELLPDQMRAYLPEGICGNTVIRLLTLLQQHYGSMVRIADDNTGNILDSNHNE